MSISAGAARSLPPDRPFDVAKLEYLIVQHPASRPKSGRTSDNRQPTTDNRQLTTDNRQPSVVKLIDRPSVLGPEAALRAELWDG